MGLKFGQTENFKPIFRFAAVFYQMSIGLFQKKQKKNLPCLGYQWKIPGYKSLEFHSSMPKI